MWAVLADTPAPTDDVTAALEPAEVWAEQAEPRRAPTRPAGEDGPAVGHKLPPIWAASFCRAVVATVRSIVPFYWAWMGDEGPGTSPRGDELDDE